MTIIRAPTTEGPTANAAWIIFGGILPRHIGALCTYQTACRRPFRDADVEPRHTEARGIRRGEICIQCYRWIEEDLRTQHNELKTTY
jgi:hypothetical protein